MPDATLIARSLGVNQTMKWASVVEKYKKPDSIRITAVDRSERALPTSFVLLATPRILCIMATVRSFVNDKYSFDTEIDLRTHCIRIQCERGSPERRQNHTRANGHIDPFPFAVSVGLHKLPIGLKYCAYKSRSPHDAREYNDAPRSSIDNPAAINL